MVMLGLQIDHLIPLMLVHGLMRMLRRGMSAGLVLLILRGEHRIRLRRRRERGRRGRERRRSVYVVY